MPLGMEMLMQGMGIDPTKLQENVNNAVAHVAQINQNIAAIAQRLGIIEQAVGVVLNHTTVTSATTLRIEDSVNKLRTETVEHSAGFTEYVDKNFPDSAEVMQRQVEGGINADASTSEPTSYVNGRDTSNNN